MDHRSRKHIATNRNPPPEQALTFPDSHVTCPSCEAVVPWSPACINCGSRLPPKPPQNPFQTIGDKLRDEDDKAKATEELVEVGTQVTPVETQQGRVPA